MTRSVQRSPKTSSAKLMGQLDRLRLDNVEGTLADLQKASFQDRVDA